MAAFFTSALAATGVGGGGFFVIYLTLVKNVEQIEAQGINLIFFLCGALPAVTVHLARKKRALILAFLIGALGIVGTFAGAYILRHADVILIRKAFGIMLAATGALALFKKKK